MTKQQLSTIKPNETVTIDAISAPESQYNQLEVLGFIPGTSATLLNKTSFSGPITFKLRGSKIAIRKEDADCILVSA